MSARTLPLQVIVPVVALAIAARISLSSYVSEDARLFFVPWIMEFRSHGALALGGDFSNYNFPYMFLLFLGSMLPVEPLVALKIITITGDFLLALSVRGVARQLRPSRLQAEVAAVVALFLPTVLLNASMWGQCDSYYTAFLMLSLSSLLRNRNSSAWVWWAVALSFKLQAVLFLPALTLIALRDRHSLKLPAVAVGLWLLLSSLPILFGRTLISTFSVYFSQTQEDNLAMGAVNVYAWFPEATAGEGKLPALIACGTALLIVGVAYWRGPDSIDRRLLLAVTTVAVCPFLLPQMHDRYFFAAEVMSLLLLARNKVRYVPWILSATGLVAYIMHFTGYRYMWPLMLASLVQGFAVAALVLTLWRTSNQKAADHEAF